jgi:hypothetical protein
MIPVFARGGRLMCSRQAMVAALLASGLAAGQAAAQDPYAEYNRARAYRHFLTSPYRTRTYSGTIPGYVGSFATPQEYGTVWRTAGFLHERISPRGHEGYFIPGQEGMTVIRPAVFYLPPPTFYPPPWSFPRLP